MAEKTKQYRIAEYCNEYEIQIYDYTFRFFGYKNWKWYRVNIYGYLYSGGMFEHPLKRFSTLESATERLNQFRKGIVYHEVITPAHCNPNTCSNDTN